jgi:D-arabinose 1-dehydrogenase-like Zn-dependent alcohol dehydrogenase
MFFARVSIQPITPTEVPAAASAATIATTVVSAIVVNADWGVKIPAGFKPDAAAQTLCAGVTAYLPITHWA